MSGPEYFKPSFEEDGNTPEALMAKAVCVDALATHLLQNPDWRQTQLRYAAPFGPERYLELMARTSSEMLRSPDFREVRLVVANTDMHIYNFMLDLDAEGAHRGGRLTQDDADLMLGEAKDADPTDVALVNKSFAFKLNDHSPSLLPELNVYYSNLVANGCCNKRYGIWHTFEDGSRVLLFISEKEGTQPWPEIDREAEISVRYATEDRSVDFMRFRDGRYETFETNPDAKKEQASIVGEENILEIDGKWAVIDIGDNAAKYAAVAEAERLVGLRALNASRLDFIEQGLNKTLQEREQS